MSTKLAGAALSLALLPVVLIAAAAVGVASLLGGGGSTPRPVASEDALADIPPDYLQLYQQAADECPGLPWTVLAAIGDVESDHGRAPLIGVKFGHNFAGAQGPMQFLPATFAAYANPAPAGGANPPDPFDPADAIYAAQRLLCTNWAQQDLRTAIMAYNHSATYVDQVLARAHQYGGLPSVGSPDPLPTDFPAQQATVPDPTGTGGRVTPRLATLYRIITEKNLIGPGASCWDRHPQNPDSDHPHGKACDLFFNPNDTDQVAAGWRLANWLTANQAIYGINYVIWQGQIWTAQKPAWTTYWSPIYGCPNRAEITGCHYDHIHVSVL